MFSFQLPLLALLAANRQGDSSGDAGRVALLAMMIRPPIVGLLMALAIAKQESPARFFKNPDARRVLQHLADLWSYDVSLHEVDASDTILKEHVASPRLPELAA